MNEGEGNGDSLFTKKWAVAITFNPIFLTDELIKCFMVWVKTHALKWSVITEKEGEQRHIHAILLVDKWKETKKGRRLDKVKESLNKWQEKYDQNYVAKCKHVTNGGVRVVYSMDWVIKYMNKNDSTEIIDENLPDVYDEYLPTAEEQLEWIRMKEEKEASLVKDCFFHKLVKLFDEMEYSFENCNGLIILKKQKTAIFINDLMYKSKVISVIRDIKCVKNIINCFYQYYESSTSNWSQYFTKDEIETLEKIKDFKG